MSEYYCYRESWGFYTNLQLYSLLQAWRLWKELECKDGELGRSRIREQGVVVISLLGLSVSQLLGQNVPNKENRVPAPRKLLGMVLDNLSVEIECRSKLETGFNELMNDYDACRHFGKPKYDTVASITLEKTRKHVKLTLSVWDAICTQVREDFVGIREILDDLLAGFDYAPQEK